MSELTPEELKIIAEGLNNYEIVPESGCWLWLGTLSEKGYGTKNIFGKIMRAHRLSYMVHKGDIPDDLIVRHTCDIPCCINPEHLIVGTNADNNQDRMNRGRGASGEKVGTSKLTDDVVAEIFLAEGTYRDIADRYGINNTNVSLIKNRKSWKHVTQNLGEPPKGVRKYMWGKA